MPEKALKKLAKRYHLSDGQLDELQQLLRDEGSAQYVLRYRKDLAPNLSAEDVDEFIDESRQIENLARERRKILKKLAEQDVLTDEVGERIESAETMRELIDYYVPFRPQKRSRSRLAIAQGLEPLAKAVLAQEDDLALMGEAAKPHIDEEKELGGVAEVLDGVFHIVCDRMAEEKSHRDKQRGLLRADGNVVSRPTGKHMSPRMHGEFKACLSLRVGVGAVHPSQMLALVRGRRLRILEFEVEPPLLAMCRASAQMFMTGGADRFDNVDGRFHDAETIPQGEALGELSGAEFLYFCIRQSLCDVLAPILGRELERELCKSAEDFAVGVLRRNLRRLLMMEPLKGRRVLGIWPGYRTGCKLAALDESGSVIETTIVYPHTPQLETEAAKSKIIEMIGGHQLSVAAIGSGTACQETEALVGEIIAESCQEFSYAVVDDVGISTYSESRLAGSELPGLSTDLRAAVATGRRLLDPLAEFTKLNLRTLCPAQQLQDINSAALKKAIAGVVQQCVADVGAELNTAPATLLRFVPGLGATTVEELVAHRERTPFAQRRELRDVPKIDEDAWRKAVGFLRVDASVNPLDRTRIHPDHYPVAEKILQDLGIAPENLETEEARAEIAKRRGEVDFGEFEKEFGVHYLVLKDLLDALVSPWPDLRATENGPALRKRRLTFGDLEQQQVLMGTVRKVVDFGVFVDVGVGEDGLVHISEMADSFVRSPHDVVSEGELIQVRVVEVDPEKKRIALSMRSESSPRRAPRRPQQRRASEESGTERVRERGRRPVADAAAQGGGVRRPESTLGMASRRVQKVSSLKGGGDSHKGGPARHRRQAGQTNEQEAQLPVLKASELVGRLGFAAIEKRGKGGKGKPAD
ncbi:MAG: Tex-like N-terminal domain-containing protein [Candidatus Brocadiia bacterium]|nr:Tex-like N-terminal domain-containing protein [Candidatus Brocadiia bacterium]